MKVIDPDALIPFRAAWKCEYCGATTRTGLDPNHVIQKGIGGGSRLDVKENLISLCRTCHGAYHDGRPGYPTHKEMRAIMFEKIAKREGFIDGGKVWEYLMLILRAPKEGPKPPIPAGWLVEGTIAPRTNNTAEPTTSGRTPALPACVKQCAPTSDKTSCNYGKLGSKVGKIPIPFGGKTLAPSATFINCHPYSKDTMKYKIPLDVQVESAGLAKPEREYRFWPGRQFKFDLAWPELLLACEIEGGIYRRGPKCPMCNQQPPGAHSSIERMLSDREKYNEAALRGWMLVRVMPEEVDTGKALNMIERAMITVFLRRNDDRDGWNIGMMTKEERNAHIYRMRELKTKIEKAK